MSISKGVWTRDEKTPHVDLSYVRFIVVRPTTQGPKYLTPQRGWTKEILDAALFSLENAEREAAKHRLSRVRSHPNITPRDATVVRIPNS